jgi:hypothetical protein
LTPTLKGEIKENQVPFSVRGKTDFPRNLVKTIFVMYLKCVDPIFMWNPGWPRTARKDGCGSDGIGKSTYRDTKKPPERGLIQALL